MLANSIIPKKKLVDLTRPYLLEIGNDVKIAGGCTILTHGFEWCVLREVYKRPFGGCAKATIGNNVFVGMNVPCLRRVYWLKCYSRCGLGGH